MRSFRESLIEDLNNPEEAINYLKVALEEYETDQDLAAFLLALKTVTVASGGISTLAHRTSLNRQNLYRILSPQGNPRLSTLESILHGLGFRLSIEKMHTNVSN